MMRRSNLLYLAGILAVVLGLTAFPSAGWATYGNYTSTISGGSLNQPAKVAVDPANGDVYVTDAGNRKVKKYDKKGVYASGYNLSVSGTPVGICVDGNYIYVGDDTNNCVWIYDKSTGALTDFQNTNGTHYLGGGIGGNWKVSMPNTIAVSPSGQIFVVDGDNDKVLGYNRYGTWCMSFGTSGTATSSGTTINLYYPTGLAFAESTVSGTSVTQYFYIGDQGNNRVQRLYYIYNSVTNQITTNPTFSRNVGTGIGDAFGKFERIADVAWDSVYSRLMVVDSLQMVAQLFDSNGNTMSKALNYNAGVQTNLNIPTGIAIDTSNRKAYVASNQAGTLSVFDSAQGAVPTISITAPVVAETPATTTYTVSYTMSDTDSATCTVKVYYYDVTTPSNQVLIDTKSLTFSGGTVSSSTTWDIVGTYPNFMPAGTYKIYATVQDDTMNQNNATSTGSVAITTVSGKYTSTMQAKFGAPATDSDLDGISNADEINGTQNALYGGLSTDPGNADSDNDGLTDGQECLTYNTNPNNSDTDNGGVSDAVEVAKGTSPTNITDDLNSSTDATIAGFVDDVNMMFSTFDLLNTTDGTIYVDLTLLNDGGAVVGGIKAVKLSPHQMKRVNPYADGGVHQGHAEVRTTVAGAVRGCLEMARHNLVNTSANDSGGTTPFAINSSTTMYVDTYCDYAPWRYDNYLYVQNPTGSSITITAKWYDGAAVLGATTTHIIPAHGATMIRPKDQTALVWGWAELSTPTGSFNGFQYRERWNGASASMYDFGFAFGFTDTIKTATQFDSFCDYATWRYKNWLYFTNPAATPTDFTLKYYNSTGGLLLTKTRTLQAHTLTYFRASDDVGTGVDWGSASVTATGSGVIGFQLRFRWNVNNVNPDDLYDFGFAWPMAQSSAGPLYLSYYQDGDPVGYISFIYIKNNGLTDAVVKKDFYDETGNLAATETVTINPNKLQYNRPTATAGAPSRGSVKFTVLSGTISGFALIQRENALYATPGSSGYQVFDYGDALELVP